MIPREPWAAIWFVNHRLRENVITDSLHVRAGCGTPQDRMTFAVLFTCSSSYLFLLFYKHTGNPLCSNTMVIFFATSFIWGSLPNMHYNYNCIFPLSSTPSFFLSLWEWKEIILAPPFLRLLSELMTAHVYLDQGSILCVFLIRHLFLLSLQEDCSSWLGKIKVAKQTLGGMLSSWPKMNECNSGWRETVDRGSVLLLSLSPLFPSWFWKSALTHYDSPRLCFHNAVPLLWNFCARIVNFSYLFVFVVSEGIGCSYN